MSKDTLTDQVNAVIESKIRPTILQHAGDIELVKIEANKIYIKLKGACIGCPFSFYTMVHGIKVTLQQEIPAIVDVIHCQ